MNSESFRLTDKAKKSLLAELNIQRNKNNQKNLTQYTSLAVKQLFYNEAETQQIERLTSLLMPELSAEDAALLSHTYDLSGGQIENISRKHIVDTILSGSEVTLEKLKTYCREELSFSHKGPHRIGFV